MIPDELFRDIDPVFFNLWNIIYSHDPTSPTTVHDELRSLLIVCSYNIIHCTCSLLSQNQDTLKKQEPANLCQSKSAGHKV